MNYNHRELLTQKAVHYVFYNRNNPSNYTQSPDELLLEKQKAQLEMYRQFAHDIASPIECLKACITYLENVPQEFRSLMDSALERACDMMSELKKARANTAPEFWDAGAETATRVVNLSQIADNIIAEKKIQLKQSGSQIILDARIEKDLQTIANPVELARVLSNLLNNAVEAMKDQSAGTVTVALENRHAKEEIPSSTNDSCRVTHDSIQITISDTGPGIAPEVLPRLMQQGATFGKQNGSGLGLFHAKKTIESLGGQIAIESQLGSGTTVKVNLNAHNAVTPSR